MGTLFPGAVDEWTPPVASPPGSATLASQGGGRTHTAMHADLEAAVEAVENFLITGPASVQQQLADLLTAVAARLVIASNLSDLTDKPVARTNLGLGSAAVASTSDFDVAGAATAALSSAQSFTTSAIAALNLGTASTHAASDFDSAGAAAAAQAASQPLDSDLTAIAALTTTSFGRGGLTQIDGPGFRSYIGAGTSSFSGAFSALSGIPTTLSGYGITDAVPSSRTVNGHALSGDVTVSKSDVGLGSVENTALSTWAGSSNIVTVGTLSGGSIPYSLLTGVPTAPSSVSNSDSTLTISPTTGAVVASLNLGHANTWTAAQTFQAATSGNAAVFKAATSTPGDITDWQTSGGTTIAKVDSTGNIWAYAATAPCSIGVSSNSSSYVGLWLNQATPSTSKAVVLSQVGGNDIYFNSPGNLNIQSNGATLFVGLASGSIAGVAIGYSSPLPLANTSLSVYPGSTTYVGLAVAGLSGQSAVLLQLSGVSSTSAIRPQADIDTAWVSSTDATRKARLILRVWDTAAREGIRIDATGSAVAIGFFAAPAVVQQSGDVASGLVSLGLFSSAVYATAPKQLFDHYASAGNSTTTETDLYSDTLAAGQLATNGEKVSVEYGGTFVSSATATRQIRIYFGGTLLFDTGALTLSLSSAWTCYATLVRVSASVVRYMVSFTTEGAALAAYTAVGELTGLTLSATNILKVTGQAAGVGAATNDIVAMLGSVQWLPAA